ncbi:uncharacterized protein LOC133883722 [Phragmites australis]|uniref:uncharacterized protein LOC133883722 n=1 Tax=Phragmites australis TaxID=29695 RepID=UPI002D779A52|nr:uncharacterized protein LOC133883722 [Phragmites australis]
MYTGSNDISTTQIGEDGDLDEVALESLLWVVTSVEDLTRAVLPQEQLALCADPGRVALQAMLPEPPRDASGDQRRPEALRPAPAPEPSASEPSAPAKLVPQALPCPEPRAAAALEQPAPTEPAPSSSTTGQMAKELASREGRALAQAVAEHVLACYQSRDPNFSLEPARQGVVEAEEGAARQAVRGITAEVAACFTRVPPPVLNSGSSSEDSSPPSEPVDRD